MALRNISQSVRISLEEDLGSGDITSQLLEKKRVSAHIKTNERFLLCGIPWANEVFQQVDPDIEVQWIYSEGNWIDAGKVILKLEGLASSLLTAERTALNWLQTLSGTATQTAKFVKALEGTNTRLLDTRKTIPGLREAQKYAVRIGGAVNHRMGLYDAFLIKENHIISCGSITAAIQKARQLYPHQFLEIEVENLEEYQAAILSMPDRIMLDNFSLDQIQHVVKIDHAGIELEVSGDVTLENIREIAETGIDFISVGSITKHLRAIDLSMRVSL